MMTFSCPVPARNIARGLCLLLAASCGSAATPPAPATAPPSPPAAKPSTAAPSPAMNTVLFGLGSNDNGERLFGEECAFCHVGKTTGAMMLSRRLEPDQADITRRTDLDVDYVKAVVRNGLVNMPPFSRVELTDAQLDEIAAYLTRNKP